MSDSKQDSDVICNQLRLFIVELVTFFCDNQSCDWALAYQQMIDVDQKVGALLTQIKWRRKDMQVADEAALNGTYSIPTSNFQGYPDIDSEVDDFGSSSNPFSFSDSGSLPFDDEIEASRNALMSIRERLTNLRGQVGIDADSAIEGIANIMGTIGKLRRAKNYSNLQGLL